MKSMEATDCNSKESAWCTGDLADPWVRKIPWGREWTLPEFLPGEILWDEELADLQSHAVAEWDTTATNTEQAHSLEKSHGCDNKGLESGREWLGICALKRHCHRFKFPLLYYCENSGNYLTFHYL